MHSVKLKISGRGRIEMDALPTSSPFFAIHRPYSWEGNCAMDSGWKLTHVPSGEACGDAIYHRQARKILRVLAAVFAAQPVDWTKADLKHEDFAGLPTEVQTWAKRLNHAYL